MSGNTFDMQHHRARQLGANGYAATVAAALDLVASQPRHVRPAPSLRHPGAIEAWSILAEATPLHRLMLTNVDDSLGVKLDHCGAPDDWRVLLATSLPQVIESVAGALLTEDATVLAESREWLQRVMATRGAPDEATSAVWAALARQLRDHPEATRLLALT